MTRRFALLTLLALLAAPCATARAAVRTGDWAYNVKEDGTAAIAGYIGRSGVVTIPSEIDGHAVTEIEDRAFINGNTLRDVTVPGSVKRIGTAAFQGMKKLERIALEEGVEEIDGLAFNGCAQLEEIALPDSVTALGNGALSYCERLTRVCLGAGLAHLAEDPFEGDDAVEEASVSPGNPAVRMDGPFLFEGDKLVSYFPLLDGGDRESVVIPEGTREIGANLMNLNRQVRRVVLPEGVERIGDGAFCQCHALTEAALPGTLREIGERAFSYCEGLEGVVLPDGLVSIGDWAFEGCVAMEALRVPESVTSLGSSGEEFPFYAVFDGGLRLIVAPGSAAEAYAKGAGMACEYE